MIPSPPLPSIALYQLSISDLGALRYEYCPFDLSELSTRHCDLIQKRAVQAQIDFSCSIQPNIILNGDKNRISQLLNNLLTNSIKYTDNHGSCQLTLAKQNNSIKITIEDTAPSVSEAQCQLLFDPLYRIEKSRNRTKGGAGLGLAICKNIVTAHQGQITASPSPLGGLKIQVTLAAI